MGTKLLPDFPYPEFWFPQINPFSIPFPRHLIYGTNHNSLELLVPGLNGEDSCNNVDFYHAWLILYNPPSLPLQLWDRNYPLPPSPFILHIPVTCYSHSKDKWSQVWLYTWNNSVSRYPCHNIHVTLCLQTYHRTLVCIINRRISCIKN